MRYIYISLLILAGLNFPVSKAYSAPRFIVQKVNVYTPAGLITSATTINAGTPLTIEGIFKNTGDQDASGIHTLLIGRFSKNGDVSATCLRLEHRIIDFMKAGQTLSYSITFTPDVDGYYQFDGAINAQALDEGRLCGWNLNYTPIAEQEPPYNYDDYFINRNLVTVIPAGGVSEELKLDLVTPTSKTYFAGETLYFQGLSSNGYFPMSYNWKTSTGVDLGTTDYSFSTTLPSDKLPPGNYNIIVNATDAAKRTAARSVAITIANAPFIAKIISPANGAGILSLAPITLNGQVTGQTEGNVTYNWEVNGLTGWQSLGNTLQVGGVKLFESDTQLRLTARDGLGRTSSDIINIKVSFRLAPWARIISPGNGSAISHTVTLQGEAYNPQTYGLEPFNYKWVSNVSGLLGTTAELNTLLPTGAHTLIFTVTDSYGRSNSDTSSVTVTEEVPSITGGEAPVDQAAAEFKILSVNISSNSPYKDTKSNQAIIEGYSVTATVVVQNSSDVNASKVPVSIFIVPFKQETITTKGDIPIYVDLPANSTKTLTVVIDYSLPANIYTFYALVNRQIKLGHISINYPTIPEKDPYNNTKVQSFVAYSCSGLNLKIPEEVVLTQNDYHRGETITIGNVTLAASSSLTLVANSGTINPGFHAQPNSTFSFTAAPCTYTGSTGARIDRSEKIKDIFDYSSKKNEPKDVIVFPNSFSDELTIKSLNNRVLKKVEFINLKGQKIYSSSNFTLTADNEWKINTTSFNAGLYLLICQFDDYSVINRKVTKE